MARILLVEDNEDNRDMLARRLQRKEHEMILAVNGEDGVEKARNEKPDIILMDEPASALDPIATLRIEELMRDLSANYTIIVVTHNMQQAARVSDYTAFFTMDEDRAGHLMEYGETDHIFTNPTEKVTEDYITGRFG